MFGLSTKKGINAKLHKQGGGWKGYFYIRGSSKPAQAPRARLDQQYRMAKAAETCRGKKGAERKLCMVENLRK